MTIEQLGGLGKFIGALAVVVSLIYVARAGVSTGMMGKPGGRKVWETASSRYRADFQEWMNSSKNQGER